jgi:hypothetical protein
VKIPLLKSAPENSGNLPSPEAAPPSTFLEAEQPQTDKSLLQALSKKLPQKQTNPV